MTRRGQLSMYAAVYVGISFFFLVYDWGHCACVHVTADGVTNGLLW